MERTTKNFIHNRMFCICSADVPLLGIEAIAGRSSSTHFARFEVRFLGENLCTIKRSRGREARRAPLENEKLCEELAGLPADQLAHIEKKGVKLRPAGRTTSRDAESFAASGLALLTSLHT